MITAVPGTSVRAKPEIDIELLDADGFTVGEGTALLVTLVASENIIIKGTSHIQLRQTTDIHSHRIWIGNLERILPRATPIRLGAGDTYVFLFTLQIDLTHAELHLQ